MTSRVGDWEEEEEEEEGEDEEGREHECFLGRKGMFHPGERLTLAAHFNPITTRARRAFTLSP